MNEYFLDQGIIIGYASSLSDKEETGKGEESGRTASERITSEIDHFAKASVMFIEAKEKKEGREERTFSTCFYIIKHDLPKFLARRTMLIEEVRRKIKDSSYDLGSSETAKRHLYPRDISLATKIFLIKNSLKGKETELLGLLITLETVFEERLSFFINKILNKVVIPIEDIDRDLMWHFHSFIDNVSDCNIMASAVQYNTNLFRITVITTDKKDWQEAEGCLDTNLNLQEKYKMPRWLYLLDAVERKG